MPDNESYSFSEPLVSVVTPFYNTEKYLSECIESILNQSYQNWEYVLVNNLSTDRSLEIANSYARDDLRIRVITNDRFVNQAQNYNRALRLISSKSKYCKIVQADDWLFPDCLKEMIRVAEANPSIGIVGAYRLDDVKVNCDGLPYQCNVISGSDICRKTLTENIFVFGSATSLLFRSDIIRNRNPFYNELSRHEDTESCYEILQEWDFGFVHQVLTFTRRENESLTTKVRQFDPHYFLDKFITVLKYGRCYLNEMEYKECLGNTEIEYYQFLGKRFWSRNRKEFFEYHAEGLKNIGHRVHYNKVTKYAFIALIDFFLNPKRITRHLLKLVTKNKA
jgi:glycosyltransferase involved in cell wall biosynthesis